MPIADLIKRADELLATAGYVPPDKTAVTTTAPNFIHPMDLTPSLQQTYQPDHQRLYQQGQERHWELPQYL